jgi:pimeloyl-ACP methyl ester carboxylesterase
VHESGTVVQTLGAPDKDPDRISFVPADAVTAPVLTIGGAKDRTTVIGMVRKVGKRYAAGDYREYADSGHWLVDEPQTDVVIGDVRAWLKARGL